MLAVSEAVDQSDARALRVVLMLMALHQRLLELNTKTGGLQVGCEGLGTCRASLVPWHHASAIGTPTPGAGACRRAEKACCI